jgi:hypothetical protein
MKKYAITLFNDTVEVVEADSHREALKKARLDGDNRWMVVNCAIALKVTRPYSESYIDMFCGIDDCVKYVNPKPTIHHDSYSYMGLA